jgi:glycosyltransferase involved in cell wall biosynthesis
MDPFSNMKTQMKVSLIICTRNRVKSLDRMLELLLPIVHDNDQLLEILVMDNGSSDETATTVVEYARRWEKVVYSNEPNKGLSHARNKAVKLAKGEILAWTDDDLVVTKDWLSNLIAPLVANNADCVVGRIEIASHLLRDWMKPFHRLWLAENIDPSVLQLIGANMAMRKNCFESGMAFDPETGPGVLGYMDDTLLGMRLRKLGKRIVYNNDARVIHHFSVERLQRSFWIRTAKAAGRSTAYVNHHWEHGELSLLWPRLVWQKAKLWVLLFYNHCRGIVSSEGIGEQEFGIRKTISYLEGMCDFKKVPFKY